MSVHEEGDSILLRTLGNDLRDYTVSYSRRPWCKIFSCIKYSSNCRYHQINIRNVCILPTKIFLCFPCDLQKTAIISRFQIITAIVMKDASLLCCDALSLGECGRDHEGMYKRRETLTQKHGFIFPKI